LADEFASRARVLRLSPQGLVEGDVIKVKGALRCAYCHGAAQGLLECCDGCGVLVHADCRRELGRCSTLGCQAPSAQAVALAARPRPWRAGGVVQRAARKLLPLGALLACLGCCVWFTSVTRVPRHSPHAFQMSRALAIRAASANFHADLRRHPQSMDEGGPYLETYGNDLDAFLLVRRGRVVWVAVGIDADEHFETETIRLLKVLYEDPPPASAAPLSSSAQ